MGPLAMYARRSRRSWTLRGAWRSKTSQVVQSLGAGAGIVAAGRNCFVRGCRGRWTGRCCRRGTGPNLAGVLFGRHVARICCTPSMCSQTSEKCDGGTQPEARNRAPLNLIQQPTNPTRSPSACRSGSHPMSQANSSSCQSVGRTTPLPRRGSPREKRPWKANPRRAPIPEEAGPGAGWIAIDLQSTEP